MVLRKTAILRKLIEDEEILMIPVAHDALCARIAEQSGFKAVFTAGYANSAALLGKPDVSLLTLTEMVDAASRIVDAVNVPVFADGDTGHGNVTNVIRTVNLFEKAGVAGLFIEDQVSPKRCGHLAGKQVVSPKEMVSKLRAALDARSDPDFVIMARTDALAVNGIDDAIYRARLYREAGADLIFVEAPESVEQMRRIIREVKAPHMANMLPGGKTPMLTARELQEIGYSVVAYATACTYAITKAVRDLFETLYRTGTTAGLEDRMVKFDEFNRLVGLEETRKKEEKYMRVDEGESIRANNSCR
jgi:2-methylisocitrate lyase-like PEP mutase family enzyme